MKTILKFGKRNHFLCQELQRNFSTTFFKFDPKVELISPKLFTKSSVGRTKTRITASDLPKKDPKEEKSWPKCKAILRHVPGSPHRLMQIADFVRGLSARQALKDLENLNRRQTSYVYKLIQSAMFNGENNHGLNAERLVLRKNSFSF
jgi:hypothetical protein